MCNSIDCYKNNIYNVAYILFNIFNRKENCIFSKNSFITSFMKKIYFTIGLLVPLKPIFSHVNINIVFLFIFKSLLIAASYD